MDLKNKKAYHNFEMIEYYSAGVCLSGTEIKSIRANKISFNDAYCYFVNGELFLKNFHISEYENGGYSNHDPKRDRKLLLTKKELRKLESKVNEGGLTIIPTRIFINKKGLAKFDIALAKGKKQRDKRNDILERDIEREEERKF